MTRRVGGRVAAVQGSKGGLEIPPLRLGRLLASRDRRLLDLFEQAAANVLRAADLLDQMLAGYPERAGLARDILVCERDGDRITHEIVRRVHGAFPTPFDPQDIHRLASALDDVVDLAEEVADYLGLYHVEAPMEQGQRLAHLLLQCAREIVRAVRSLRVADELALHTATIRRLEKEGDRVTRQAFAALFESGIDPMVVIRWKDLFARLEAAIDASERAADILDGIALKNF